MPSSASAGHDADASRPAAFAAFAQLALTSVHHAYGALIYASPWRLEVVVMSIAAAALIAGLWLLARRRPGSFSGRLAFVGNMVVIVAFPILAIGLFEGGYNHVVKNIVHLAGNPTLYAQMFPASMYEAPGDWLFELTGIAQFPMALLALWLVAIAVAGRSPGSQVVAAKRSSKA